MGFWFNSIIAQEGPKIIEILQAGGSTQDQQKFPGANILVKKDNIRVHLLHEGALIKSNISYFYPKQNFFKANGNVIFTQGDTLKITCDYIEYDGTKKLAIAWGKVLLERTDMNLKTDTLYLDRLKSKAYYNTFGTILDEESYLNKITQLFFFRKKLSTCYSDVYSTDPVFLALKDTVDRYKISRSVFDDLISGMEDDLYNNRYRTFDELYDYCYRVASVVGLMCIEIYGYSDPRAKKYAESWGIFMQLTNVLRDVGEDIERDRVYLPLDELEKNGIQEMELDGKVVLNKTWEPYCYHYAKRARTYLEEARQLLPLLPRRTRYSPAAMIAFYDKILRQIEKEQGDVFTKRVKLNKLQKMSLAAAVYVRHRMLPRFLDPVWNGLAKIGLLPSV
mgnify:CR=1 FL=1